MPEQEIQSANPTLHFINTEIGAALDRQSHALDQIEAKTAVVVGYAVAAAAFLATRPFEWILGVAGYLMLALSVGYAIRSYWTGRYPEISPSELFNRYYDKEVDDVVRAVAASRALHYDQTAKTLHTKVGSWNRSLRALVAATALMVAALVVQTVVHDDARPAGPARPRPAASQPTSPAGRASPAPAKSSRTVR
jgi:hypothetical protein